MATKNLRLDCEIEYLNQHRNYHNLLPNVRHLHLKPNIHVMENSLPDSCTIGVLLGQYYTDSPRLDINSVL